MRKIIILFLLIISGCDSGSSTNESNQNQPVISPAVKNEISEIKISYSPINGAPSAKISLQSSLQLTAIAYYEDNSMEDVSEQVVWVSSDPTVAKITDTGIARGIHEGVTTITAQYDGADSNSVELAITDTVATNIQIRPASGDASTLPKGEIQPIVAIVTFSDRTQQELLNDVTWISDDTSIATVTSTGVVKGVNIGVTKIRSQFNGVDSNAVDVTVTDAVVTKLQILPKEGNLNNLPVGFIQPMTVTGVFSDNTQRELLGDVSWFSEDTSVVTMAPSGTVKAISEGSTTIYAEYAGIKSEPSTVIVTDITLTEIIISLPLNETHNLVKGNDIQLVSTGIFSDDSRRVISSDVSWFSDNESVASINDSGLIHGIEIGQSNISAEFENIKTNFIIDVDDVPVIFNVNKLSIQSALNGSSIKEVKNGEPVAENLDVNLIYKGNYIDVSVLSVSEGIQAEDAGHDFMVQKDVNNNVIGFAGYANVYRTSEANLYSDSRYTTFFSGYSNPNDPQTNGVYRGNIFYTRSVGDDVVKTGSIHITLDKDNASSCLIKGLVELKCSLDTSYDGGTFVAKILNARNNSWYGVLHANFYGENGEFATGYIFDDSTWNVDVFLLSRQ